MNDRVHSPADRSLILLIDDEPGIRQVLSMLLEDEGYEVIVATQGREALERLSEMRPGLIITDHMMPFLTGLEFIQVVRTESSIADIPILLMSAALPADIDVFPLDVAFLAKPPSLSELLSIVNNLLTSGPH